MPWVQSRQRDVCVIWCDAPKWILCCCWWPHASLMPVWTEGQALTALRWPWAAAVHVSQANLLSILSKGNTVIQRCRASLFVNWHMRKSFQQIMQPASTMTTDNNNKSLGYIKHVQKGSTSCMQVNINSNVSPLSLFLPLPSIAGFNCFADPYNRNPFSGNDNLSVILSR